MSNSGKAFVKQAENVAAHILNGIDFVEKYANFLNDRAQIEAEYDSKLQGLLKKYVIDAKTGHTSDTNLTYVKAYNGVMTQLTVICKTHGSLADSLKNTVSEAVEGISDKVRDLRARHQNCVKKLSDHQNGLNLSLETLKTAMKELVTAWNNGVLAEQKYKKADANQKLPRKVINDAKQLSEEEEKKAQEARKNYKRVLKDTNMDRRRFYGKELPSLLQELKLLDVKRIQVLGEAIERAASLEQAVWPEVQAALSAVAQLSETLDAENDASRSMDRFQVDFQPPQDLEEVTPQEGEILHEDTLLNLLSGELDHTKDQTGWVASITPTAAGVSNMLKGMFRFSKRGGKKSDGGRSPGSEWDFSSASSAGISASQIQPVADDDAVSVASSTPSPYSFQSASAGSFEQSPGLAAGERASRAQHASQNYSGESNTSSASGSANQNQSTEATRKSSAQPNSGHISACPGAPDNMTSFAASSASRTTPVSGGTSPPPPNEDFAAQQPPPVSLTPTQTPGSSGTAGPSQSPSSHASGHGPSLDFNSELKSKMAQSAARRQQSPLVSSSGSGVSSPASVSKPKTEGSNPEANADKSRKEDDELSQENLIRTGIVGRRYAYSDDSD